MGSLWQREKSQGHKILREITGKYFDIPKLIFFVIFRINKFRFKDNGQ